MKFLFTSIALLLAGCSGTAGSDSRDLTAQQCRSYYQHTYQLDGLDVAAVMGEEQLNKDAATCAETGMVTKRHFDCAMAAGSVEQLRACGAPNS
jgi:hypothetical protein